MHERTAFPQAIQRVTSRLINGDAFTINSLAKDVNLNRRTVEKVVNTLLELQKVLESRKLDVMKLKGVWALRMTERTGLLSLPENIQKMIVRTAYYPTPSREEEVLTHLYLWGATSPDRAVQLSEAAIVQKLVEQGQLEEKDGMFYLTDEGLVVARGALELYPELRTLKPEIREEAGYG